MQDRKKPIWNQLVVPKIKMIQINMYLLLTWIELAATRIAASKAHFYHKFAETFKFPENLSLTTILGKIFLL